LHGNSENHLYFTIANFREHYAEASKCFEYSNTSVRYLELQYRIALTKLISTLSATGSSGRETNLVGNMIMKCTKGFTNASA
jgi:hypothetical protein